MDQTAATASSSFTKLKGKEIYPVWCTKLEALLDKLDLYDHIEATAASKHVEDEARDKWMKADLEGDARERWMNADLEGDARERWMKADCRAKTEIILALSDDIVYIVPRKDTASKAYFVDQEEPPDIVLTKRGPVFLTSAFFVSPVSP